MQIDRFLSIYHDLIGTDTKEEEFAAIKTLCRGLSSQKLGKLLNAAVGFLEPNEIYCEIGSFAGYTLISAGKDNYDKKCVGIDNFNIKMYHKPELQEAIHKRLLTNLDHFQHPKTVFINKDFREFAVPEEDRIGVFYVDGDHAKEETIDQLKWGHQFLADRALVVLDDISIPGVHDAASEWIATHTKEYKMFFYMDCFYPHNVPRQNTVFWNGLCMMRFERKSR